MKNICLYSLLCFTIVLVIVGCQSTNEYLETTKVEIDNTLEIIERKKQMPPFDLEELLKADQIVLGTVAGILPSTYYEDNLTDNPHVITNVVIHVTDTLKGNHYDKIAVMRVGGIAEKNNGERIHVITNAPHYSKDEKVLLFLKNFDVYDPPKGFRNKNHFYLKAYGKWGIDQDLFSLEYEGVQSKISLTELKEKINRK